MTCDACVEGISGSIEQLLSDEFVAGIVDELSGNGFCGGEFLEDIELCASVIAELIPLALPALTAEISSDDMTQICNMAVPDTCSAVVG